MSDLTGKFPINWDGTAGPSEASIPFRGRPGSRRARVWAGSGLGRVRVWAGPGLGGPGSGRARCQFPAGLPAPAPGCRHRRPYRPYRRRRQHRWPVAAVRRTGPGRIDGSTLRPGHHRCAIAAVTTPDPNRNSGPPMRVTTTQRPDHPVRPVRRRPAPRPAPPRGALSGPIGSRTARQPPKLNGIALRRPRRASVGVHRPGRGRRGPGCGRRGPGRGGHRPGPSRPVRTRAMRSGYWSARSSGRGSWACGVRNSARRGCRPEVRASPR